MSATEEFWEDFYRDDRWSGKPNALLVDAVSDLAPGTALDLGCGEGGDAIWLASRGWRVTGADVSSAALARAAEHAAAAGVADAIDWQRHDLAVSFPSGSFDIVSACYLHSPVPMPRDEVLRSAAAAVAPGGSLLVVGHAAPPSSAGHDRGIQFPTPQEMLDDLALPAGQWEVIRSDIVTRQLPGPGRKRDTRTDNVLRVERLGS
jgi:SAM-dependent methyltransferase